VLLLDNSAWARLCSDRLARDRAETIATWMDEGRLATSLPFLLEAGYSARSGPTRTAMMRDLARLPRVRVDREVEEVALGAQQELADVGHHRLPPADLTIAACAHVAGMGVLHYDGDYDLLASRTSLDFESAWLAPGGTL
jgi:predicted nucleic acid-binding protein